MKRSESIKNLLKCLFSAQCEFPSVKFDSVNPYYNSKYASLGQVIETVKPVLEKYGLGYSQLVISDQVGAATGIETMLFHDESGEWISSEVIVAIDGKNLVQEAGKTITYMRRYALASMLGLYSEEDMDGNSPEKKEPAKQEPKKQPDKEPVGKSKRPYTALQLLEALAKQKETTKPASDKQVQLVAALLGSYTENEDERHRVQKFLFGTESLKDADKKMVGAALTWLDPIQDSGGDYVVNAHAVKEIESVITEVNKRK